MKALLKAAVLARAASPIPSEPILLFIRSTSLTGSRTRSIQRRKPRIRTAISGPNALIVALWLLSAVCKPGDRMELGIDGLGVKRYQTLRD